MKKGVRMTQEQKDKISASLKGHIVTEQTRQLISQALNTGHNNKEYLKQYYIDNKLKLQQQAHKKYLLKKEEIKEKVKQQRLQKNIDKYGVPHPTREQIDDYRRSNRTEKYIDKDWLIDQHIVQKKTICQIAKENNLTQPGICWWIHKHEIQPQHHYSSSLEAEICDYIGVDCVKRDRKIIQPMELDIVVPQYNLAIEVNGLFWHRHQVKQDRLYHQRKTLQCREKGYTLLTITDKDWYDHNSIVKSMIDNKMNRTSNTIYGRNTTITISKDNKFLIDNHIQGTSRFDVGYQLIHNNEPVMMMTFVKSRFNRKYEWEIHRIATRTNTNVIGGVSKLFKQFVEDYKPTSVITYSNLQYGYGDVYKQIGFQFDGITAPNYCYFNINTSEILSRQQMMKHKQSARLPHFDENLTEYENALNHKYDKVYDCGSTRWIITKK